jgi:hypothetical protein
MIVVDTKVISKSAGSLSNQDLRAKPMTTARAISLPFYRLYYISICSNLKNKPLTCTPIHSIVWDIHQSATPPVHPPAHPSIHRSTLDFNSFIPCFLFCNV